MALTTINQLGYADQNNNADMNESMHDLAVSLDTRVVGRYATTAARDAAIPTPVEGQVCFVGNPGGGVVELALYVYNGSAWAPYFRPKFAYKTALETVTSSTAVQNDDHLSLTFLDPNATYELEMLLIMSGADAGDFKFQFSFVNGGTVAFGVHGYTTSSTAAAPLVQAFSNTGNVNASTPTSTSNIGTHAAVGTNALVLGMVTTGSLGGILLLQWAQNTSDVTATTLYDGSYLLLTRVA